jgi:hypothetical protein
MVLEHRAEHTSQLSVTASIAAKIEVSDSRHPASD